MTQPITNISIDDMNYLKKCGWRIGVLDGTVCRDHPHGKMETVTAKDALVRERGFAGIADKIPRYTHPCVHFQTPGFAYDYCSKCGEIMP